MNELEQGSLRIATPENLDKIFSLECFKYLEMKALFKTLFEHMNKIGLAVDRTNARLNGVPDPNDIANIMQRLAKNEADIVVLGKDSAEAKQHRDKLSNRISDLEAMLEELKPSVDERFAGVEERSNDLQR